MENNLAPPSSKIEDMSEAYASNSRTNSRCTQVKCTKISLEALSNMTDIPNPLSRPMDTFWMVVPWNIISSEMNNLELHIV